MIPISSFSRFLLIDKTLVSMPRMGLMALKTRDENVPFGSLVHSDAVIYVGRGVGLPNNS